MGVHPNHFTAQNISLLRRVSHVYRFVVGVLKSDPLHLPGRHGLNLGMLLGNVGAMGYYMMTDDPTTQLACLGATTTLSSIMGVTLTAAIGGQ